MHIGGSLRQRSSKAPEGDYRKRIKQKIESGVPHPTILGASGGGWANRLGGKDYFPAGVRPSGHVDRTRVSEASRTKSQSIGSNSSKDKNKNEG